MYSHIISVLKKSQLYNILRTLNKKLVNYDLKNMIPLQLAFSNAEKFDLLNVGIVKSGVGASSIEGEYMGMPNSLLQGVYCISLDSIYENKFFKKPNYIKIDVDGHESIILENAVKILTDKNLKGIIIEYEYSGVTDMDLFISKICSYGFKLTLKSEWFDIDPTNNNEIRNFLFER